MQAEIFMLKYFVCKIYDPTAFVKFLRGRFLAMSHPPVTGAAAGNNDSFLFILLAGQPK